MHKKSILIKNARIVNEGSVVQGDLLIEGQYIKEIADSISVKNSNVTIIDAENNFLIPGVIDDQVHFREPGLTHKASIETESRAAIAGGITSFIEMPNTNPQATTIQALEDKFEIAAKTSSANYSFMFGGTNDNLDEILKVDPQKVAGLKLFLGSSTGNMLVDNPEVLEKIFKSTDLLISVHCEDEETIKQNTARYLETYGEDIPIKCHPEIRSAEVHHLWFSDADYEKKGTFIKWNPAVKSTTDRAALWTALLNDKIDIIATDHAPHTLEEKLNSYMKAPSGGPLVQHALVAMMEAYHSGKIAIEKMVEKMCHNPAILFQIEKRGYIKEGYFADLVLVNPNNPWTVNKTNVLYKCGWSPFEGSTFKSRVSHTILNGTIVYENANFNKTNAAMRLTFKR